jgi:hypothetical protein
LESKGPGLGNAVLGGMLVLLGVVFLLGQALGINLGQWGWPLSVIVPGLALCALGLGVRKGGEGLFVLGSMVTTTGLILFYGNATRHWASWAYAWALIAPTSVGLGQIIYGTATRRAYLVRTGSRVATVGLTIFLVAGAFFEVVLGIGGRGFGSIAGYVFPGALIALGVLMLLGNLLPSNRQPRPQNPSMFRPGAEEPTTQAFPLAPLVGSTEGLPEQTARPEPNV